MEDPDLQDLDLQFRAAYGEALFFAHLIEDLIATHLAECSYFRVNGYPKRPSEEIRRLKAEERIDELLKIYNNSQDASAQRFVDALHILRRIRNQLAHAFIDNAGAELRTEEGIDQVLAMLKEISHWERAYFRLLSENHEKLLRLALKERLSEVMLRNERPFDPRIARSKIRSCLAELKALQDQ